MGNIVTPKVILTQENLQIQLVLWATATQTKPDKADTLQIRNKATLENHVKTILKNQGHREARVLEKAEKVGKALATSGAKINYRIIK